MPPSPSTTALGLGMGWYGVRLLIYQAQSDLESPMVARQVIDAIPTGNLSGQLLQKLVIT